MNHHCDFSLRRSGWIGMIAVTWLLGLAVLALTFLATQAPTTAGVVEPVVASTEPFVEYVPNMLLPKRKPGVVHHLHEQIGHTRLQSKAGSQLSGV